MRMYGKYYLEYEIENNKRGLLIEVRLKQHEDKVDFNQNIYYGEVTINGNVLKDIELLNWVDAKFAAEDFGLNEKQKLLNENKKIKIISEKSE